MVRHSASPLSNTIQLDEHNLIVVRPPEALRAVQSFSTTSMPSLASTYRVHSSYVLPASAHLPDQIPEGLTTDPRLNQRTRWSMNNNSHTGRPIPHFRWHTHRLTESHRSSNLSSNGIIGRNVTDDTARLAPGIGHIVD
jgi:hypothetical protein